MGTSMRILLTGGSGFLGSYLLRHLIARGHTVGAILRSTSNLERIADCAGHFEHLEGTLDDLGSIESAVHAFAPDALAHLAWSGVGNSARNDRLQFANIAQSHALIELAIAAGANHVLALGSQAEYGPQSAPIIEEAPTRPTTLYGAAKLASCHVSQQQCVAANVRYIWMRVFSTYGSHDSPHWMIPSLIEQLLKGQQVSLTRGEQLWDYLHVEDAARAMVAALESPHACGIFNLGSGQAKSIRVIATFLRDLIDPNLVLGFGDIPYRPDQVMLLEARIQKLIEATGWRPQVSLEEGLRRTVQWYIARNRSHYEAKAA